MSRSQRARWLVLGSRRLDSDTTGSWNTAVGAVALGFKGREVIRLMPLQSILREERLCVRLGPEARVELREC